MGGGLYFWFGWLDADNYFLLLHERLWRHRHVSHGFTSSSNISECRWAKRRYYYVVLGGPGAVLHRLLRNAGGYKNGIRLFEGWCFAVVPVCWRVLQSPPMHIYWEFPRIWRRVNPHTKTPVNSVWLVVLLSSILVCIGIGSNQTIVSIFNITAPGLDLSYIAVIFAFIIYRDRVPFIEGPFTLGKWGTFVRPMAIAWVCFISVVLFFPTVKPVTAKNMCAFPQITRLSTLNPLSTREALILALVIGIMPFVLQPSLPFSHYLGGGLMPGSKSLFTFMFEIARSRLNCC